MLKKMIISKLNELGKPMVSTGEDYIMTTCLNPTHNDKKPSFSINTSTGFGKCFTCSFSVDKDFWLTGKVSEELMETIKRETLYYKLLQKKQETYEKFVAKPPRDRNVSVGWRGLTKQTINKFGLYECHTGKYRNRVVIPLSDDYFDTRTLGKEQPKYLRSRGYKTQRHTFPYNTLKETTKDYVVVVEGILDCISLWQDGIPSICNFGVSKCNVNKEHLIEAGIEKIFVMFDEDEAGITASKSILHNKDLKEYFGVYHARNLEELKYFYASDYKDYNEFICKNNDDTQKAI